MCMSVHIFCVYLEIEESFRYRKVLYLYLHKQTLTMTFTTVLSRNHTYKPYTHDNRHLTENNKVPWNRSLCDILFYIVEVHDRTILNILHIIFCLQQDSTKVQVIY